MLAASLFKNTNALHANKHIDAMITSLNIVNQTLSKNIQIYNKKQKQNWNINRKKNCIENLVKTFARAKSSAESNWL